MRTCNFLLGLALAASPALASEDASHSFGNDIVFNKHCTNCSHCDHLVPTCNCVNRDPGHPAKPKHEKPGDRNWGDWPPYRYRMCDCDRAGDPHCVAKYARCAVDRHYSGGYVGGGAAAFGRGRCNDEGTWGLDYHGLFHPGKFFMRWTCGRKQGGEGAYETDREPKVVAKLHQHQE